MHVHPTKQSILSCAFLLSMGMLAWSPGHAQTGPVIDDLRARGRIILAHREASIPFSYVTPDKQVQGYAVDVCRRIAAAVQTRLGMDKLEVQYRLVTPANRIEAIEKGEAHLECGSTTNNAARRERVAFTVPHFITGARLLVKADSPIDRLDHPGLRKVVSTRNTTPLVAVNRLKKERFLNTEVLEAEDHEKAVVMVEEGKADAFAMDDVLLFGLAANRPDPKALKVVGRFLTTEPLAIMLPKGDPAFKKIVDDEMRRLVYSREIHADYDRWFMQPIPPRNVSLNLPTSYLLRDFWKYPTDQVP